MKTKVNKKLWGAAFTKNPADLLLEFTTGKDMKSSVPADEVLIPFDIETNKVHAAKLVKAGFLSEEEFKQLDGALDKLLSLYGEGSFTLEIELEDVHTNIEAWLTEEIGIEIAGKLHTGRSRNDQATNEMFLYLHSVNEQFIDSINDLINELEKNKNKYDEVVCPGYTHHQPATITSFGLILGSFAAAFKRDLIGFENLKSKFNFSPLGAVTAYGTTLNIGENNFESSIDVITNRGEFETNLAFNICEFLNHASNLAQTLILFSTKEFGFVELAEEYSTGSSIMPQKKNPDPLELIKAKAGYAQGILMGLLSITKSSFIGYNRDSQQTKSMIMDLVEESKLVAEVLSEIISTLKVNKEEMAKSCEKNFITATGFMEQIISNKNIPMRIAKKLIELAVKHSGNSHFINPTAFKQAVKDLQMNLTLSDEEIALWQKPDFQFNLLISKNGK